MKVTLSYISDKLFLRTYTTAFMVLLVTIFLGYINIAFSILLGYTSALFYSIALGQDLKLSVKRKYILGVGGELIFLISISFVIKPENYSSLKLLLSSVTGGFLFLLFINLLIPPLSKAAYFYTLLACIVAVLPFLFVHDAIVYFPYVAFVWQLFIGVVLNKCLCGRHAVVR